MAVAHNLLPRIIKSGLGMLPPTRGIAGLESVLRSRAAPPAQVVASPFEWRKLMAGTDHVFPVALALPLFALCSGESKPHLAGIPYLADLSRRNLPAVCWQRFSIITWPAKPKQPFSTIRFS